MIFASSRVKENTSWVSVGNVDQIGMGQGDCFLIGTRKIALFRLRNNRVYALEAVCPHRGGPLADGIIGRETVIRPLHGYKFSLTDGHDLESDFSIGTYATEIRNGRVYVSLPF